MYTDLTSIIVSAEHRTDILNIWTDNGTSRGHSVNVWSTKVYNGMPKAFPEGIPKVSRTAGTVKMHVGELPMCINAKSLNSSNDI